MINMKKPLSFIIENINNGFSMLWTMPLKELNGDGLI